jgi:hypothetical protein
MTDLRDAAEKALKALEGWKDDAPSWWTTGDEKTITALRAALEQPEQAPAAWINPKNLQGLTLGLYGYAEIYADESQGRIPLYTHPPRREWRSLSGEEIRDLWSWSATAEAERTATTQQHAFARAVEAALKGRNHD